MSATNDVSQSEDSANSLIDRSSAAASTKKRDAPSATSEDDAAPASDAAPAAPSASRDAKRRRVEDPAPTSVPALEKIRRKLGTEPADLARPDEAVRLYTQRRGDSDVLLQDVYTLGYLELRVFGGVCRGVKHPGDGPGKRREHSLRSMRASPR